VYSGGAWLAFPLDTPAVPEGPFSGDVFAAAWWDDVDAVPVGRGGSPSEAYDDLVRRLDAIRPTRIHQPASELSGTMWHWNCAGPQGMSRRSAAAGVAKAADRSHGRTERRVLAPGSGGFRGSAGGLVVRSR
jgi:hypothetical protein